MAGAGGAADSGVNATPAFYSEAEYYAAPVDELRTYPVYVKGREPRGYRLPGHLTYLACPAVDGAGLLTTVTVTADGYCFE